MKTIGIIAYADHLSGGVYQYTLSMIDALKLDDSHRYIIITHPKNRQFDNLHLEVRRVSASSSFVGKLVKTLFLVLKQRNKFLVSKSERLLFSDIDLFISPIIDTYPYYFPGKPFIFTFHDMQERYYPHFFPLIDRIIRAVYARALCSAASHIITESRYVKNDLMRFLGVLEEKVVVIPAPPPSELLDHSITSDEIEWIRVKYSLPENFIFYPAQLWHHKNHVNLLEALVRVRQSHPDLCLVLTGAEYSGKSSLDKKIVSLGLVDSVHFLGFIDYSELPAVYRLSRMLVMPSLYESISIPVYEAFALGVPVVCSNVLALPEQVGNAGLLFDPLDPDDMAEKVASVLENNEQRESLIVNAYKLIKNYNHFEYMKRLRCLIDGMVHEI